MGWMFESESGRASPLLFKREEAGITRRFRRLRRELSCHNLNRCRSKLYSCFNQFKKLDNVFYFTVQRYNKNILQLHSIALYCTLNGYYKNTAT